MINLAEVTKDWQTLDGWKIAPAGLLWIRESFRIRHGADCKIGNWCNLGNGCNLGNWCNLGDGCKLGDSASDPVDIGFVDGYRKTLSQVEGVAYIGAGCHWSTLADAVKHWEKRVDRELTRGQLLAAIHMTEVKGWSQS